MASVIAEQDVRRMETDEAAVPAERGEDLHGGVLGAQDDRLDVSADPIRLTAGAARFFRPLEA